MSLTETENEACICCCGTEIETDSLLVDGVNILEFNYDYDLNRDKLLQKYIDKEVIIKG